MDNTCLLVAELMKSPFPFLILFTGWAIKDLPLQMQNKTATNSEQDFAE
jgi:hypothetical protein